MSQLPKTFPVLPLSPSPRSFETFFSKISHNLTPPCLWGNFNVWCLADVTCRSVCAFSKKSAVLWEMLLNSDFKTVTDFSSLPLHLGLAPGTDQAYFPSSLQSLLNVKRW